MPEPQEFSEDEEEPYINIFRKWYLSRGENNPRGGLTALLSQHSDLNHDEIRDILKGQQATELLFEAIFTGIGHEKQGIDFFQILNPQVIVSTLTRKSTRPVNKSSAIFARLLKNQLSYRNVIYLI